MITWEFVALFGITALAACGGAWLGLKRRSMEMQFTLQNQSFEIQRKAQRLHRMQIIGAGTTTEASPRSKGSRLVALHGGKKAGGPFKDRAAIIELSKQLPPEQRAKFLKDHGVE